MSVRKLQSRLLSALPAERVKRLLERVGYDHRHWTRPVMHEACTRLLRDIGMTRLDVLEISAGQYWRTLPFRSFRAMDYPQYDICQDVLPERFDLVIADQVFEHLLRPYQAARHVHAMLRDGGYFLVSTPFLIKIHAIPHDCTRWTETGLKHFLAEAGFDFDGIATGSWGNRACIKANFNRWARRGWFGSLKNEPEFPVTVWALARKA